MTLLRLSSLSFILLCSFFVVHGAQTFWPAAIPLAVRTPYLNAWMYTQNTSTVSTNNWPSFWNPGILGWICYIRVDGQTYTLMGNNNLPTNYNVTAGTLVETQLTPTRTIQVIQAGPMNVTLTFLSPITPSDMVRQSLPFAYMAVDFVSTDGESHDIQLYSDISGEWLSGGSRNVNMTWASPIQTSSIVYHQLQLLDSEPFQELDQQAIDGTVYYAMLLGGRNITWETCQDTICREEFVVAGGVHSKNNNDTFREITDDWPVFPISVNLGSVASSPSSVFWVVGYVRDPSISYSLSGQTVSLRPYYSTEYSTIETALEFFVSDFNNSLSQAETLDAHVEKAALNISTDGKLYDMLSLASRQVFSSLEITAPQAVSGQSNTRIFMKDMGTTNRVTPVENLYAALPMFLYYNASLVKTLLLPLLEQQNSSSGAFPFAAKDIGTKFPEVSGPTVASQESVEQTGNMLIIALAHAQYSNDTSLLHSYYGLLQGWAEYLTTNQNGLFPNNQMSIDDGTISSNSTNLAAKGVYAIRAMAEISHLVGQTNDSQKYSSIASTYMSTWQANALSSGDDPSVLMTFGGEQDEWVLPYNLYPQTLLGFNLLNDSFFEKLTVAYAQQLELTTDGFAYGLPIDSIYQSPGNIAWNAFTAATFTNDTVRAQLFDALWKYASFNGTLPITRPFGVVYDVESGTYSNGTLSPAMGGLFAPFLRSGAISIPTNTSSGNSPSESVSGKTGSHSVDVGAIAGGVIGIAGTIVLIGLIMWILRRHKTRKPAALLDTTGTRTKPTPFESSPTAILPPQLPLAIPSEKRRRAFLQRENIPLLSSTGSSSSTSGPSGSSPPAPATSANAGSRPSRTDELFGLRSEIEDLRRIMLGATIGRPEPSELDAPPEYS